MTTRAHGERRTYQAGCRCLLCRAANSQRTASARQAAVALVLPDAARAHLERLRTMRVGLTRAAQLSGVSRRLLLAIRRAKPGLRLRASTERRILEVPARPALHTVVSAVEFWRYVRLLRREGFADPEIAAVVGWTTGRLWTDHKRVRRKTYLRLMRFYRDRVSEHHDDQEGHTPA